MARLLGAQEAGTDVIARSTEMLLQSDASAIPSKTSSAAQHAPGPRADLQSMAESESGDRLFQ
jgi:hypothetical protein